MGRVRIQRGRDLRIIGLQTIIIIMSESLIVERQWAMTKDVRLSIMKSIAFLRIPGRCLSLPV